jgi:hypothetical protein
VLPTGGLFMRRFALAWLAAGLIAATAAVPVAAARATHITGIPIASSDVDTFLSDECGFEVTLTVTGSGSATLVYNSDGLIIREVDTEPGSRVTWSGNGTSFGYPANIILVTSYPEGATIGAPAKAIFTGFFQKIPGQIPNAGPDIILGHVEDFSPEGLPLITFDEFVASHGPRGGDDFVGALCTALGG